MIIVLAGSSAVARVAIGESVVKADERARHLSLEKLMEAAATQNIDLSDHPELLAQLACHCAAELATENLHTVLSIPDHPELLTALRQELGDTCRIVHLAGEQEGPPIRADLTLNTSRNSIQDSVEQIRALIPA
jgi:hypothetical protein